jgi:Cof subfamily protein (haloacid dehalogenase superfamily)
MTVLTARFPDPSAEPPDVRLVVVDMDGTLLDPDHRLPAGLGALLADLAARGVRFSPASGRQHATLVRQLAAVGPTDDLVVIAENGSYVAQGGRELSSVTVARDVVDGVVRTVRELAAAGVRAGAIVCGKRSAWVEDDDPAFLAEARQYYALLEQVDDLLAVDDEVLKVAVFDAGNAADTTAPRLERFAATHRVVVSGRHWVDVMDPDVHKGVAVRAIQERLGITPDQTMAFGDYLNDLEMLDAATWSFAMANAHPAVRARARYLAPSNADDGVVATVRAVLHLPAGVRYAPVPPAVLQMSRPNG